MKKLLVAVLALVGLVLWLAPRRAPASDGLDTPPEAPLVAAPAPLEMPPVVAPEPVASTAREPVAEPAAALPREPEEAALAGALAEFHGQLLDALSQRPIAGARVLVSRAQRQARADELTPEEIAREVQSDADGFFVLPVSTRGGGEPGHVLAEGYGARRFLADGSHPSRARAELLELLPAAGLEVRVREAGAPAAGARVELVRAGEHFQRANTGVFLPALNWRQTADADGLARFAGLPAEIELAWSVLRADGEGGRAGRLALAPGETRRLEVVLGGARLVGEVRDEQGVPVPGLALWLAEADAADAVARTAVAKAHSDENGRFEFTGVPFERFVLGPSPEPGEYVARAEEVVVVDQPLVAHDLVVTRGLFLEGRVVGDEAELERLDFLSVSRLDGSWFAAGDLAEHAFRAGPLPPGEYLVSASGYGTSTASVRAAAGTSGIELPLLGVRELVIRLQGAGGPCELAFHDPSGSTYWRSHAGGDVRQRFAFGEHVVLATTADGRVGFLALTVDEHTPERELVLELAPGAFCTFVHRAQEGTRTFSLRVDGAPFPMPVRTKAALAAGAALELLVPARPLVAELCEGNRVVARETLAPAAGERLRVELVPAGAR